MFAQLYGFKYSYRIAIIFYPYMGPKQILSLQVKVDVGATTVKEYSALQKWSLTIRYSLVLFSRHLFGGEVVSLCSGFSQIFLSPADGNINKNLHSELCFFFACCSFLWYQLQVQCSSSYFNHKILKPKKVRHLKHYYFSFRPYFFFFFLPILFWIRGMVSC